MSDIKFKNKIIILTTTTIFIILSLSYIYFATINIRENKKNIEKNIYEVAKLLSEDKDVKYTLNNKNKKFSLQNKANKYIAYFRDIDIIVIADKTGIKYSHIDENQIGQKFINPVNWNKLKNNTGYYSTMKGSIGVTFRRFEPIFLNNNLIGFIMVGKYDSSISNMIHSAILNLITLFIVSILISILLAMYLGKTIKKELLGLEPKEIKRLYLEEKIIIDNLESVLIALNTKDEIIKVNSTFYKVFLFLSPEILLKEINKYIKFENNKYIEITINANVYYLRILPMYLDNKSYGRLIFLKEKKITEDYAKSITGFSQLMDGMRASIHEFKNRLHVILGLISLKKLDLAKSYIMELQNINEYDFKIYNKIENDFFKAMLIGKYSISLERGIKFTINPNSNLKANLNMDLINDLVIISSNLIENSIEAVSDSEKKEIDFFIKYITNNIYIEIKDSGKKIPEDILDKIFEYGVSTKGENRGIGLHLVREKIKYYNGNIELKIEGREKIFKISLPINEKNEESINYRR